jgi:hypothetical protein
MISISLIIEADREISWYGREISDNDKTQLLTQYHRVEDIEILEACFDYFNGPLIADPHDLPSSGLKIRYFFHDQEDHNHLDDTRLVKPDRVNVIKRRPGRHKCEQGESYICGGEQTDHYREIRVFETGFLPPFKHEDVTLVIEYLGDFGFDGYILTDVLFEGRNPAYCESDIRAGERLPTKILED